MANTLNIGGSADDPFYRYKMPKVTTTLQKKSGGTTVVDNTTAICASLSRDASHIAKLKRPVSIKNNNWSMHGEVKAETIQDSVQAYIQKFVLCGVCGNPETVMDTSTLTCKSCGGETKL
jgi:translation initiation factor 5